MSDGDRSEHRCMCVAGGFCERRNRIIHRLHFDKCNAGHVESIDNLYADLELAESNPATAAIRPYDKSTVGTQIRTAIETAADFKMQCGHLLNYLRALNKTEHHDAAEIVTRLLTELELPSICRTKIGSIENQRTWLTSIVAEALR